MRQRIVWLLVICMLWAAVPGGRSAAAEEAVTATAQKAEQPTITWESFSGASDEKDKTVSYTYGYTRPVVKIPEYPETAEKIQQEIDKEIEEFLGHIQSGYFGVVYEEDEILMQSFEQMEWRVIRCDNQIVSLCMDTYGYDGGIHGWHTVEYLNFFADTGERVLFEDLGKEFRETSMALVKETANFMQLYSVDVDFFPEYEERIGEVVLDGTETLGEVYPEFYGDDPGMGGIPMTASYGITETGFVFTSGEYVLQAYAYGMTDFSINVLRYGDSCRTDLFDLAEAQKLYDEERKEQQEIKTKGYITFGQWSRFSVDADNVKKADRKLYSYDSFAATLAKDFTGTWYNPKEGTAIRLTEQGAYVYYPAMQLYGNVLYEWEILDRSALGKCPQLTIYCWGREQGAMAYYICGSTEDFFWCNMQEEIFYRIQE